MNYINFNFLSKNKKNVLLQIAQFAKIILAKFAIQNYYLYDNHLCLYYCDTTDGYYVHDTSDP